MKLFSGPLELLQLYSFNSVYHVYKTRVNNNAIAAGITDCSCFM